ncbi:MAG: hypothetical protein HY017_27070 [Betaproteobacteria bacterium]|nr:hypothetical protein [Betaproteobacteria bacterium]
MLPESRLGPWALAVATLFVIGFGFARPAAAALPDDVVGSADIRSLVAGDFNVYDPGYRARRQAFDARLDRLWRRLKAKQMQVGPLPCSTQIYIETKWLLRYTADWKRLAIKLDRLGKSLANPEQDFALAQSPDDGSWGACYDEWFLKLDATVDGLNALADKNEAPKHPVGFLAQFAKPSGLIPYVEGLLVSDVARTGIDHRLELAAVTAAFAQILLKESLREFMRRKVTSVAVTDGLIVAFRGFLDRWQDPANGYWGASYLSDGQLHRTNDLSMAFHNISYTRGEVRGWSRIIDTTLAIKRASYPQGWLFKHAMTHHNNYDVVKILQFGWPYMTASQRRHARMEIEEMLHWCMTKGVGPDGVFLDKNDFHNSSGDALYFGVSFLDAIGYWNPAKRFWIDAGSPRTTLTSAHNMCPRLKAQAAQLATADTGARAALERLVKICPDGRP